MSERLVAWLHEQVNEDERDANDIHDRSADAYMDGDCVCDYPKRVLAEVEFKRKLLADYENSVTWSMDTLRDLASTVYKDRPGYAEAMSGE